MGLIENAKDAAKLVQQIGNMELYEKLVSLQMDAMAMADENWRLKDEVRSLKEQLEIQKRVSEMNDDMEYVQDGGFYIRKSERTAGRFIPYCPLCWKSDRKDVPLNPGDGDGFYRCKIHDTYHETAASRAGRQRASMRDEDSYS